VVLGFHPAVAPVKVSVLPLVTNKPEIVELAKTIFGKLQNK
jgi:glycyl-tRNA synthetase (class II)